MFGINISKAGNDVKDTGGKVFSSFDPSFSIRQKTSVPLQTVDNSNYGQVVYTHNFGYIPQVLAYTTTRFGMYVDIPQKIMKRLIDPEGFYIVDVEEDFKCLVDSTAIYIEARVHIEGTEYDPWPPFDEIPINEYPIQDYTIDLILSMEEARLS